MSCDSDLFKCFMLKFHNKSSSWFNRCRARLMDVSEVEKSRVWIVRGRAYFGDREPFYVVYFVKSSGRYFCTCYSKHKLYGHFRMRNVCTHVGSVILWRMLRGELNEDGI
ncbi:MAG: hypothetical protein NDF57_02610 [archaeon GBS-70-058]|nr:hypothetical protein [Candidatus Culexarchaeum nevadense]